MSPRRALGIWLGIGAAVLCLLLAACSTNTDSPEQQIRAFVEAGADAAQQRQLDQIKELISPHYRDDEDRTRQHLLRVMAGYFLRHKTIHLFTQVVSLEIQQDALAEVVVHVAMAGSPIPGVEQILDLHADLFRFDMTLQRDDEGAWRLHRATWRAAQLEDFMR